ncbi:RelA/SpoT domain-containing protein [Candidatus Saccharibacteria bacterium]|nr:RelA/SpoT domain-containing protein [Candidatus Saccharibacteria bacterium]MBR0430673.1 RelA/SpoT domain-containing protein [Candidatus Saccharibacteria bacterium]
MNLSNTAINKIGDTIRRGIKDVEYEDSVDALNVWREAHVKLMDEYYDKCVRIMLTDESTRNIIVAQRLKRLPTIIGKLNRFKTMRLSSMQDIAGVRMIVRDMDQLAEVEKIIRKWKNFERVRDYINDPKSDGYRCKHFIFKKDGMYVEIQLRTQMQHIWATSVETVDIFRSSSMKFGGGETYWRDFFRQTSSAFAIAEGTNPVRCYSGKSLNEICTLLKETMDEHRIGQSLNAIEITKLISVDEHIEKNAYYLVLDLDFNKKTCYVASFKEPEYDLAVREYQTLERKLDQGKSVVLVSVSDIKRLDEAYPNYFLNLRFFNESIKFMLEMNKKRG